MSGSENLRRWRLILGEHSEQSLTEPGQQGQGASNRSADQPKLLQRFSPGSGSSKLLSRTDQRRDKALQYLYQREYQQRDAAGINEDEEDDLDSLLGRFAGRGGSRLTAPTWLRQVRELFPSSTAQTLQKQALERYGLDELITDPEVLESATPSLDLVGILIAYRSLLPAQTMTMARRIIRKVVNQLEEKLRQKVRNALLGPRQRQHHGGRPSLANLDWPTTLRRNLKHYDQQYDTVVLERLFFFQRNRRQLRWDIIVVVDQSGSMHDSVIHSAVLAAIFTSVDSLRTRLILFDTSVVDITDQVGDPVEVLLGVQLGGGTDIASAMDYAASRVENPRRTMIVLVTDFFEGGDPQALVRTTDRLQQNGVTTLGLAALDDRAEPDYDHALAQDLANVGMEIGAMTPDRLAEWVGRMINS